MSDPRDRIAQLERGIRLWRRAALVLASALALFLLCSGWLVTWGHVRAEQAKLEAKRYQQAAIQTLEAKAQHRFLDRGSTEKAK